MKQGEENVTSNHRDRDKETEALNAGLEGHKEPWEPLENSLFEYKTESTEERVPGEKPLLLFHLVLIAGTGSE